MNPLRVCFGPRAGRQHGSDGSSEVTSENGEPGEMGAQTAADGNPVTEAELASPDLTAGMASEPRRVFKTRFRGALKRLELRPGGGHLPNVQQSQFIILAKIFSEEDAFEELRRLGDRHPSALLQILPFILNGMLYGSLEKSDEGGDARKVGSRYSFNAGRKKRDSPSESSLNVIGTLVRNATKLSIRTDGPFQTLWHYLNKYFLLSLSITVMPWMCAKSQAPQKYEQHLEQVIFEQCMKSVHFALQCSWYFVSSLTLGPKSSYHRTMRLLLGMESVVMVNKTGNEKLFGNAELQQLGDAEEDGEDKAKKRTQVLGTAELETVVGPAETQENGANSSGISPAGDQPGPPAEHSMVLKVDTSGDGKGNVALTLPKVASDEKQTLDAWLDARKERSNFFHAELDFVKCLTDLSFDLFTIPRHERKDALRNELEKLNQFLPKSAFIPVVSYSHRILSILPSEAFVFSTKERSPYLITFEIEKLKTADSNVGKKLRGKWKPQQSSAPTDANYPADSFMYTTGIESLGEGAMNEEREPSDVDPDDNQGTDSEEVDPELIEAFGEPWSEKEERIRKSSPNGHLANWALASCIVKSRDQLRQEMFAMRLIIEFVNIFEKAKLRVWVKPYEILATSADSGFIETIYNSKSLSSLRSDPKFTTLPAFFREKFGGENSSRYKRAVTNFVRAMAGYSVVSYILAIKDRHNGNLMMDAEGHLCHIDFGFLLSNSPGGNREFEKAPFKLTQEMIDTMGGPNSPYFRKFRRLCGRGYAEACKHMNKILLEVDMMYSGNESMPCFVMGRRAVLDGLRERMMATATTAERMNRFDDLLRQSMNNWTTRWYDRYQRCFTGIN